MRADDPNLNRNKAKILGILFHRVFIIFDRIEYFHGSICSCDENDTDICSHESIYAVVMKITHLSVVLIASLKL